MPAPLPEIRLETGMGPEYAFTQAAPWSGPGEPGTPLGETPPEGRPGVAWGRPAPLSSLISSLLPPNQPGSSDRKETSKKSVFLDSDTRVGNDFHTYF